MEQEDIGGGGFWVRPRGEFPVFREGQERDPRNLGNYALKKVTRAKVNSQTWNAWNPQDALLAYGRRFKKYSPVSDVARREKAKNASVRIVDGTFDKHLMDQDAIQRNFAVAWRNLTEPEVAYLRKYVSFAKHGQFISNHYNQNTGVRLPLASLLKQSPGIIQPSLNRGRKQRILYRFIQFCIGWNKAFSTSKSLIKESITTKSQVLTRVFNRALKELVWKSAAAKATYDRIGQNMDSQRHRAKFSSNSVSDLGELYQELNGLTNNQVPTLGDLAKLSMLGWYVRYIMMSPLSVVQNNQSLSQKLDDIGFDQRQQAVRALTQSISGNKTVYQLGDDKADLVPWVNMKKAFAVIRHENKVEKAKKKYGTMQFAKSNGFSVPYKREGGSAAEDRMARKQAKASQRNQINVLLEQKFDVNVLRARRMSNRQRAFEEEIRQAGLRPQPLKKQNMGPYAGSDDFVLNDRLQGQNQPERLDVEQRFLPDDEVN